MSQLPIVDRIRIIPRPDDFLGRNVGSSGEVFFNRETNSLRVYSGRDRGGFEIARADFANVDKSSIGLTNDDINWIPYAELTDLPSATDNHGMFAHVHSTGKAYYAHSGNWIELANQSDIPTIPTSLLDLGINDGTSGQFLSTDGAGNFSFATVEQSGGASVDVSLTPPTEPQQGNIWYDLNTGKIYVYVDDGDTSQWVQPVATSPTFSGDYNDLINKPNIPSSFDQVLNTNSDVEFNSVTAASFVNNGVGAPSITSASTITLSAQDGVVVSDNLSIGGLTTLGTSAEKLATLTGATGVVAHNTNIGAIFYHTNIAANFTANFTNVPTTDNRTTSFVLILSQGGTAYIPTAVQIDGAVQTINWQGASTPTGNANQLDAVSFTLIRTGAAWTVIGSLTTYG